MAFKDIDAHVVDIGEPPPDVSRIGCRRVLRNTRKRLELATSGKRIARLLDPLPAPGESLHVVMDGTFSAWSLVGAVVELIEQPIDHLWVSTLSFHRDNAMELLSLLDGGRLRGATLNVSTYFRSSDADIFDFIAREMRARGQRIMVTRSHAKLLMFDAGPRAIVCEMSANLRTSRNWEQSTIFDSRELLEFHRGWILALQEEYNE